MAEVTGQIILKCGTPAVRRRLFCMGCKENLYLDSSVLLITIVYRRGGDTKKFLRHSDVCADICRFILGDNALCLIMKPAKNVLKSQLVQTDYDKLLTGVFPDEGFMADTIDDVITEADRPA